MWEQIIRRFFLSKNPPDISARLIASDPDLKNLQKFLGRSTDLESVLSLRNDAVESVWLEKSCLLFQYSSSSLSNVSFPPPSSSSVSFSNGEIAGAFVIVLHRMLPPRFWENAVLKMWKQEFADNETVAFSLNIANQQQSFREGRPMPDSLSSEDFRQSFAKRSEELFSIGSWLAMEVKTPISQTQRVFLLTDFSKTLCKSAEQKFGLRALALFLLLLLGLFSGRGVAWPWSVSFRWRIAVWFSLALVLPILGFTFLGYTLLVTEKVKCRQEVSEQMKLFSSRISERFPDFCDHYGQAIHRTLVKAGGTTTDSVLPIIHAMVRRGTLSSYYLTDTTGRVKAMYDPQREPHGSKPLKTVLEITFSEKKFQFISSSTTNLVQAGNLEHSLIGPLDTYFMTMDFVIQGQYRLLLLEVAPEILEQKFVSYEIRRQGLHTTAKQSDYSSLRWEFVSPAGSLPRHSPVMTALRHVPGFQGLEDGRAFEGEVEVAGCPLYLRIAAFSAPAQFSRLTTFRPLVLFPQKPWQEKIAHRHQQIIWAAGVSLGLSLLLGLLLATGLLEPMRDLDRAVKEIRTGNLDLRLPELGNNEIGRLNQSYNAMAQGLLERRRMQTFVSSSVLEAVREKKQGGGSSGEIRTVSVLFSHIKDFHTLSKMASPQEIFVVLNEFLAGAEESIRALGGEVDKFIGDAVMATFSGSNREIAAVKAALVLTEFVAAWNRARQKSGLWTIRIGIGINTGDVMMGDLGSSQRKDLTAIGDTVNLAARLESVSAAGRRTYIILSASTLAAVEHLVAAEKLEITHVKGKAGSLCMYELIGINA